MSDDLEYRDPDDQDPDGLGLIFCLVLVSLTLIGCGP